MSTEKQHNDGGAHLHEFRTEVMCVPLDYAPKPGETCEYQREAGYWIPCEIIREHSQQPTRYLARYVSHTGIIKTGIVGACNLRRAKEEGQCEA